MGEKRVVPSTELNNCGGRCRLLLHMDGDRVDHITGDPMYPDLMPCIKGVHAHETFLGADRLLYPMRRVGKRGEGLFERISWQEAIDTIVREWIRIRDTYGPASRYVHYGWGVSACMSGLRAMKRLLRLDGGHLDYYNSYSTACCAYTTPYIYGTDQSGSTYDTLVDAKLILLWSHNPAETRFDNLMYWLRRAREKDIPILVIDPRKNATVKELDAEWLPLRPGTDAALMDAMAYVIYTENLYDHDFVENHCMGFTRESMPAGTDPEECYFDYLTGTRDHVAKTPEWAEPITGVSSVQIRALARRFAQAKPAALLQGYGGQRHMNGEQFTRGGIMLACLTGNVGISGGWASGAGYCYLVQEPKLPSVENPVRAEIPVYGWTMALEHPEQMTSGNGLRGTSKLDSGIKMLFNLGGNALINQHGDINHTKELLADETKCECIVCSDLFLTPSAAFADILLPGVSMFEMNNITSPWSQGNYITYSRKVMNPLGESRDDYDWIKEVAKGIGLYEAFTEGHDTTDEWLQHIYRGVRDAHPELPEYDRFRETGIYRWEDKNHVIAFADKTFPTPSGRAEIYSPALAAMKNPMIPPIPGYVEEREGYGKDARYPLQLIGWHSGGRTHSVHDNNPEIQRHYPQELWMHPSDAALRDIRAGEMVRVFNDRGEIRMPVHLTEQIMEGTVAIAQGAWYKEDKKGVDVGGSINVLISQDMTPLAHGNGQHTCLVEVTKQESAAPRS